MLRTLPSDAVNTASCYLTGEGHPADGHFTRSCSACKLSTGEAVSYAAPDDLSKVKLIVISDYPGAYETEFNWPQVPNISVVVPSRRRRTQLSPFRNSGQLLREVIGEQFGICPWGEVYYTNAIKCDPNHKGQVKAVSVKHLKTCSSLWLEKELKLLDEVVPSAPMIVGGAKAVDCVALCYPEATYSVSKWSIKGLRGKRDLEVGGRKTAVTFNPALIARNEMRIEEDVTIDRRKRQRVVTNVTWWSQKYEVMLGTPLWHFIKDISWLKEYISDGV